MKTYNIGIDLTYGTSLDVEANSIEEAIEIAKKQASDVIGPRNYHYVGVQSHSEYELDSSGNDILLDITNQIIENNN